MALDLLPKGRWSWFVTPSGGPVPWYQWPIEAPLTAHPFGMAAWLLLLIIGSSVLGIDRSVIPPSFVLLTCFGVGTANQLHKLVKWAYGRELWTIIREVVWRQGPLELLPAWLLIQWWWK